MHKSTLEILKSINRFLFATIQVVNNDFVDTSRTCDADKLRCRASLSPIAFSFLSISCLISERCCYITQPLFCLGFRGFHGPKENDND